MTRGEETCSVISRPANAAEEKLTEEDRAKGITVIDPCWGYRCVVDRHHENKSGGLILPFDFDIVTCQDMRNRFEIKSHDIIIATYPKCGTTWMQQIILLLMRGSDTKDLDPMRDAMWLEMSASSAANGEKSSSPPMHLNDMLLLPHPADDQSNRRVWKTHSPVGSVPWKGGLARAKEVGAKIVIVSRNPKDAGVSMFHHTKNIPPFCFDGQWHEFAPLFLAGKVEHGSFWDWYRHWWNTIARNADQELVTNDTTTFLWVHFEDLKKDLTKEIQRISIFLGLERSDEEIVKVSKRCTFRSMKNESEVRGDKKKNHFRSGKVNSWVDAMSPEEVTAFNENTRLLYSECSLRFN